MIIVLFLRQASRTYNQEIKQLINSLKIRSKSLQKPQKERKIKLLFSIAPRKNIDNSSPSQIFRN